MAKKWNIGTINDETFEINTVDKVTYKPVTRRDIWDCYERPSARKENIFKGWADWFLTANSYDFRVASYNCMIFTIEGYIIDTETNIEYYVYITPSHNSAWIVDRKDLYKVAY